MAVPATRIEKIEGLGPDSCRGRLKDVCSVSDDAGEGFWRNSKVRELWLGSGQNQTEFRDYLICFALSFWTFFLYSYALGVLEFFRHTEADRTLISWEMVKSGDYLIPRILGDVILTKPPLFYWWTAFFLSFFNDPSEYAARLSSVVAASVFAAVQFLFILNAGGTRRLAVLCSLMLTTGAGFFALASVAEIDMTFALVSSLAFYFTYFAILRESTGHTFLAHAFAGLAFLCKGPAAICMFYGGAVAFAICRIVDASSGFRLARFWRLLILGAAGSVVLWTIVFSWLIPVSREVGWNYLFGQFDAEVVQRIRDVHHRHRGAWYYLLSMLSDLLPWVPIFLFGLLLPLFSRPNLSYRVIFSNVAYRNLFVFCLAEIIPGLLMLSASDIKTSRYFFPYYGLVVTLTALALVNCSTVNVARKAYALIFVPGLLCGLLCVVVPILSYAELILIPGVDKFAVSIVALVCGVSFFFLGSVAYLGDAKRVFVAVLLVVASARVAMVEVYAPYRNTVRSVKPIVQEINNLVPEGVPIYSSRLFERWISYYLLRSGRIVRQDVSAQFPSVVSSNGKSYFFLSEEDDFKLSKRLVGLLNSSSSDSRILATYALNGNRITLLEVDTEKFNNTAQAL